MQNFDSPNQNIFKAEKDNLVNLRDRLREFIRHEKMQIGLLSEKNSLKVVLVPEMNNMIVQIEKAVAHIDALLSLDKK